tara:strand:+ start:1592 stop:2353 length:762 start_codon:yes stop_codon:yes gene_type:complete
MRKIIWIDVGTHFGQEYSSIFGSNYAFFIHAVKRIIGKKIFNRGKFVGFKGLRDIISTRARIRKRFDEFYTVFVEANPKIAYTQNIYLDASMVFNLALTNDIQGSPLSITKLYLGDGSELSQGSSVFLEKENVKKNSYVTTLGVSSTTFFNELQSYFEKKFEDYDVILRLNCEGVEDEVIYAAHNSFGKKLKLICGSLKDVEGVKGLEASQRLDKFIKDNRLLFVNFHSGMISWLEAHAAVLNLLEEKQNLKK